MTPEDKRLRANARARAYRQRHPERRAESNKESKARRKSAISAYNKEYYAKDADHHKERSRIWRAENPEKVKARSANIPKEVRADRFKSWRGRNLETAKANRRAQHFANHDANLAANKDWKRRNPEKNAFYVMKRQAAKLQAIPSWADMDKIEAIYTEARRLTELTGILHHVDHIVPLQSPWVCGLHCEANLQILPYYENQSKSNRVWPGMPDLTGCSPLDLAA